VALTSSGYDVELVARRLKGISINNSTSIQIKGDFGDKTYLVSIVHDVSEFTSKKDIIFICTKSYDAIPIIPTINGFLEEDGTIVTIQNSFWIDKLKKVVNNKNSVCMYLDIAFETKDNITYVFNTGGATIGVYDREGFDDMQKVRGVLENICEVHDTCDLYGFLIGRDILNTAISSLGAISGMKLGDILNDRNGRYLFVKIITESVNFFESLEFKIVPYNNLFDYYMFTKKGLRSTLYRLKMMHILRLNNRNIRSSALVDLERGKKTELAVLMTSIIEKGKDKGINMPYITAIRDMIVEIEGGIRRVDKDAFYDKKLLSIKEN